MSANVIIFDAQYTSEQVKILERAMGLIQEATDLLKKANLHKGWKCYECNTINDNINTITTRLSRLDQGMTATADVLSKGGERFSELEDRATTQASAMANDLNNKYGFEASNYGQNSSTTLPVTRIPQTIFSNGIGVVKPILSWIKQKKISISSEAGLGNKGLSYLEALYKFYTGDKRGLTGASDLFNLGDKSVGIWSELYNYLKKRNKDLDIFSTENQKKVGGLGIAGSSLGLISSIFGVADKINSGNLGTAGVIGEIIGVGDKGVDLWESIIRLQHVGEEGPNFVNGEGVYSPLTLWSAFGKTAISTGAQAFKSIDKYASDGEWNLGDTGRTGIESGIAGLYTMFDKLSFGELSALGNVTGFTPENISADIENWADSVGKSAGNYILSNPSLHETYNNSGPIGKTAITFHAAIQSGIQSVTEGIGNWFQSLWH